MFVYYTGKHKHSDIQKTLSPQETKHTFIESIYIPTNQIAFWAAPDDTMLDLPAVL